MRDLSSYFKLQHKGGCNTHMELGKLEPKGWPHLS